MSGWYGLPCISLTMTPLTRRLRKSARLSAPLLSMSLPVAVCTGAGTSSRGSSTPGSGVVPTTVTVTSSVGGCSCCCCGGGCCCGCDGGCGGSCARDVIGQKSAISSRYVPRARILFTLLDPTPLASRSVETHRGIHCFNHDRSRNGYWVRSALY